MAENREIDFVFYSLESGPFDIPAMEAYMAGMAEASGDQPPRPLALRIPSIREGGDSAYTHVRLGLEAGAHAIVFPHVQSAEDAATAVDAMGRDLWPGDPDGRHVAMLIVEDREGVDHVGEIVASPGVSVVFAGPGDLRRAYERDRDAVEDAIQAILAACLAHDVPCGITADVDDITTRLDQGFRVIITRDPDALGVARRFVQGQ